MELVISLEEEDMFTSCVLFSTNIKKIKLFYFGKPSHGITMTLAY